MNRNEPSLVLGVLAGGRSSRFGTSKLQVTLDGQPILAWLAQRLRPACGEKSILSLAPGQPLPPGAEHYACIIRDAAKDQGPLAGIGTLLRNASDGQTMLIAAADMPVVTPEFAARLLQALDRHPAAAAVMARWPDGQTEPLPSLWRAGPNAPGTQLVAAALATGERAIHRLATNPNVPCLALSESDRPLFLNVNRRADLRAVAVALGVRVRPEN